MVSLQAPIVFQCCFIFVGSALSAIISYDRILRTAHWPGAVVEGLACDERCGRVQVRGDGSLRHPSTGNRAELIVCTADDHMNLAPLVRRMTSEVSFGQQRGPPHTLNRVHKKICDL